MCVAITGILVAQSAGAVTVGCDLTTLESLSLFGSLDCPTAVGSMVPHRDSCTMRCDEGYRIQGSASATVPCSGRFGFGTIPTCESKATPLL